MGNKFCSGCGEQVLRDDAAICYNCGYWLIEDVTSQNNNEKNGKTQYVAIDSKSPFLAIIFSVILPGAGQLYNKQLLKGLLFQLGLFVSLFISWIFLFIPTLIAWVAVIWEAYSVSEKMNRGEIPLANPTAGEIILFLFFWLVVIAILMFLPISLVLLLI
jgi:TM2 domain-containing membrane protein YozV